jgi:ribosomal protein L24
VDPKGRTWWASVVVTAGPNAGKTGWVMEVDLA